MSKQRGVQFKTARRVVYWMIGISHAAFRVFSDPLITQQLEL